MKKYQLYLLSLLSAFLLYHPWTDWCTGYTAFIALVPLLIVEQYIAENKLRSIKIYGYAALTFFVWNMLTTWWLKNASFVGMLTAFLVNTFLYTNLFQLFHLFKKAVGRKIGYAGLVIFWLAFEYFYLNAEISWTWLNLGNAFAKNIRSIQWYEYTGTIGGSLWILIVNIFVFRLINILKQRPAKQLIIKNAILVILSVFIPAMISFIRYYNYKEIKDPVSVLVVQPNIDPYKKFVSITSLEQTNDLINTAKENMNDSIDYIVCPETAITSYSEISQLNNTTYVTLIREFLRKCPDTKFIVGFTLSKTFLEGETVTATARKYTDVDMYYDTYNSAVQIDTSQNVQIYHKSQLVVGVEKMPYPKTLKFLQNIMVKLGGTFRSHAIQKERSNLISSNKKYIVAPVICYENIFGEFVSDFIKKDANMIFVITNEGWWGDTQSHRHLNYYSRLRAIENRRSVVRSANTGTSSIINQRGDVIRSLGWWRKGTITGVINANNKKTFYSINGDYIGKAALFFSLLCLLMWVVNLIRYKKKTI